MSYAGRIGGTRGRTMKVIAMLATATLATQAAAQLYKCKRPDGKIVYSDTRCESSATGDALKIVPNSSTGGPASEGAIKDLQMPEPKGELAMPGATLPATPARGSSRPPGDLSYSQRDRLRELGQILSTPGTTAEQRTAANLETQSIKSGRDSNLSSSDRDAMR
jgi:hypothetical protein